MNVLMLGGNRFVGVEVLWQLLADGHDVTVLALDPPPEDIRPHVRWLHANRNDGELLSRILRPLRPDAVVDNIAYEPAHVRTLAAALPDSVRRYSLTSTADCYPRNVARTWHEDEADIRDLDLTGLTGQARYTQGKRATEAALRACGIPWTVVRPCLVTGPRDNARLQRAVYSFEESARSHFWPARVMDGGPVLLPRETTGFFQLAWVGDVARAVTSLLNNPAAAGQAYNVAGDEIWSNERLLRALASVAGVDVDLVHAPRSVIEAAGLDYSPSYGTVPNWSFADNAKLKATGWTPTPVDVWMPRLLEIAADPLLRVDYHQRLHEIALAHRVKRRLSEVPKINPAGRAAERAAPSSSAPVPGRHSSASATAWVENVRAAPAARSPAPAFYRTLDGAEVSAVGIGTSMGDATPATDWLYERALVHAASRGINVFDTAINYRQMRSERCVGRAVRRLGEAGVPREALLVCTKGGYVTADPSDRRDATAYVRQEYVASGLLDEAEAARRHSINPAFIARQLEQSRANLGLDTIDVYYLHNPETELPHLGRDRFHEKLGACFDLLEAAVKSGKISRYGLATWQAFRVPPEHSEHLSLAHVVELARRSARKAGHERHHLAALQLPFNARDREALDAPTQTLNGNPVSALTAAARLGLHVFTSASVLQGAPVAAALATALGAAHPGLSLRTAALAFNCSTEGVGTALVGMKRVGNVEEALGVGAAL